MTLESSVMTPRRPTVDKAITAAGIESTSAIVQLFRNTTADEINTHLGNAGFERVFPSLEEAGFLPVANNPNPYDPISRPTLYDDWALKHPSETERYKAELARRESVLRYLYLGSHLRRGTGGRLSESRALPDDFTLFGLSDHFKRFFKCQPKLIEKEFKRLGIEIKVLEQAGIVPAVRPLPAYYFQLSEYRREKWRLDNPAYEVREEALRYLYAGAFIDRMLEGPSFKR